MGLTRARGFCRNENESIAGLFAFGGGVHGRGASHFGRFVEAQSQQLADVLGVLQRTAAHAIEPDQHKQCRKPASEMDISHVGSSRFLSGPDCGEWRDVYFAIQSGGCPRRAHRPAYLLKEAATT